MSPRGATINGLGPLAVRVLDGIRAYARLHGRTPTNPELAVFLGISAKSIPTPLGVLESRGWIRRPGFCRTGSRPELTDKVWTVL